MKKIVSLVILILVVVSGKLFSQDTLPNFTMVESGNKVVVSWTNPYGKVMVQLNVQRSYDSLRNYSTIFSSPSPEIAQNGYTDTRPPANRVFYRIFYVLEGGSYFFSKVKRSTGTSTMAAGPTVKDVTASRDINSSKIATDDPNDKRIVTIKIKEAVFRQIPAFKFRSFRDSILRLTRDTLFAITDTLVNLSPYVAQEAWKPSTYIYVNRDGYINISLPAISEKKYHVKFFEENGASLFDINNVKESPLILEKSTFVHSGWFIFELYEDDKLKEKNKIYLPKDF